MQKIIISLICSLLPAFALADTLTIRDNAPDRYVVVKGDTLWDISAKFFTDPWKWPDIWGLNKETIKNPHRIYPGDVVLLDRNAGTLKVEGGRPAEQAPSTATEGAPQQVATETAPATAAPEDTEAPVVDEDARPVILGAEKRLPQVRVIPSDHDAIPSIPLKDIKPFLERPMVVEKDELDDAPMIVSGFEGRTLLSNNDIAYVKDLPADKGIIWQIYRPGKPITNPSNNKILGYEATYLGKAKVEKFDNISTVRISGSAREIFPGDRLIQVSNNFPANFIPRAPDAKIYAHIVSIVHGIQMAGQKAVVVIDKGQRQDLQNGHVLALYRKGEIVKDPVSSGQTHELPYTRYGLLFVFRTFENISYGLVMEPKLAVELMDVAQTP